MLNDEYQWLEWTDKPGMIVGESRVQREDGKQLEYWVSVDVHGPAQAKASAGLRMPPMTFNIYQGGVISALWYCQAWDHALCMMCHEADTASDGEPADAS